MLKLLAASTFNFPGMNISREIFNSLICVLNLTAQFCIWRKRRIAQPLMTYHALLVGIGDPTGFRIAHRAKRLVDLGLHLAKKIVREFHPADVDRKAEIVVTQKVLLKALPERRRSHKVNDEWQVTSDEFSLIFAIYHMLLVTCHLSLSCRRLRCPGFLLNWYFFFWRNFVFGFRDAHQPLVEPADDVLQALDSMPRLAGARKLVRFVGKAHHYCRDFSELERAEHLFAARAGRCAIIRFAQDEHHRCLHIFDVSDWRTRFEILLFIERR